MYQVKLKNRDGGEYVLHDLRDPDLFLIDPILSLEMNKTGTFSFSITPDHPYREKIKKMSSEIEVLRDGSVIYAGRPLNSADDLENVSDVTCEGILSYLLDSQTRPFTYTGSIQGFFIQLINSHNAQVDENKRFKLGSVTVADSNNYINRSSSEYARTLDVINNKLIKTHGGYLRVRFEADGRYLDYLADYGHVNTQVIEFGENLRDLSRFTDGDSLITAVIPLGAQTEEDGINGTKKRLTIQSVNNGKDYLVNETAKSEFGYIFGTVIFEDVTLPENLKRKGQAYLDENSGLVQSLELSAVDLHTLNVNIEAINLGDWVSVKSPRHGLDKRFFTSKRTIHLTDPGADTLSMGRVQRTMTFDTGKTPGEITEYVIQTASATNQALLTAIETATELITGGKGGYVVLDRAKDGHPQGILIMDHPERDDAVNVIQINKNGIGFSNSGIRGPYKSAWTIDGMFNAQFINSETLTANMISTGTIDLNEITLNGDYGGFKAGQGTQHSGLFTTYGAMMYGSDDRFYVLVTDGGVRMTAPGTSGSPDTYHNIEVNPTYASMRAQGKKINLTSDNIFIDGGDKEVVINAGGTWWHFKSDGIYCNSKKVVSAS